MLSAEEQDTLETYVKSGNTKVIKSSQRKMEEGTTRKERRRRRAVKKMEGKEFENSMESLEFPIQPHAAQSSTKLIRRDTYVIFKSRSSLDITTAEGFDEDLKSVSGEGNNSPESRNFTYNINSDESRHDTYNIDKPEDPGGLPPIPAPRKRRKKPSESEKISSDTDRDVTEIDLDETRLKSDTESKQSANLKSIASSESQSRDDLVIAPIPKPRKLIKKSHEGDSNSQKLKPELSHSLLSLNSKDEEKSIKSDVDLQKGHDSETPRLDSNEFPLITDLQNHTKSEERTKEKKEKKLMADLFERKGKKKSKLSSVMKLEKRKMPKIASILKELKEEDRKQEVPVEEEDKTDFQIDSPNYQESAQNGRIYVQGKNGFYVMERDEVLRNGNGKSNGDENDRKMEDSAVKTAILFQKYWSRSMIYFHGILAGFAFSHAATVTAIMIHYNYQPKGFIAVYSCLSLKIHFIFYTLTALCIVSCFDRTDIGHINKKHWQTAWKIPSIWIILFIYIISFGLTFSNQKTEVRFDAYLYGNQTEQAIWDTQSETDIQISLLTWFHTIWARDMLLLFAWLMISLTRFTDFLLGHLNNMAKYAAETKKEDTNLRRIASRHP